MISSPKYRPDIDGLRGIAVLAVMAFHYFPGKFPGGFVGVDVFFVVSGFLITSIVVGSHFTFAEFYARRVRRLFPALALFLAACLVCGWFALPPAFYEQLGKHTAASAGFVANLALWGESGYFVGSDTKILVHLWSLGIEEQFYLAWPFLLRIASARPKGPLGVCIFIAFSSFVWSFVLSRTDSTAAYYSPLSRFWELALGGLLAVGGTAFLRGRFASIASSVGLVLIAVSVFVITGADPFPGWRGLLPVGGTWLVAAAGPLAFPNRSLLSSRWLVWVGLISYPLYLWHWAILAFVRILTSTNLSTAVRLGLTLVCFVPAWLTYRLIEKRVRKQGTRTVYVLCVLVALVGFGGYKIFRAEGVPQRTGDRGIYQAYFTDNPPEFRYAVRTGLFAAIREQCDFYDNSRSKARDTIDSGCYTPTTRDRVLLWGDSHAQQFYSGLSKTVSSETSILQITTSGCSPSLRPLSPDPLLVCNKSNALALTVIRDYKPRVVILAQRWEHEKKDFHEIASSLAELGVSKVILIGPVPQWQTALFRIISEKLWDETPERSFEGLEQKVFDTNRILKQRYRNDPTLTYVAPIDFFCNAHGCLLYLNGNRRDGIITHDYGHLTPWASLYFAQNVLEPLVRPSASSQ